MADSVDLNPDKRLQPSLLDRLADDRPDKPRETSEHHFLTMERLRASVLRDLGWLLNADNFKATNIPNLKDYPDAAASTINYGIPPHSGQVVARSERHKIEEQIRESILRFEPRLLPQSVTVKATIDDSDMSKNALKFEIEAIMWAEPLPLQLLVNAQVDLETGNFQVESV